VFRRILSALLAHQAPRATELKGILGDEAAFDHPRLIHGDLGPTTSSSIVATRRINNVIDFAAGRATRHRSGSAAQVYGELIAPLLPVYPEAEHICRAFLPRLSNFRLLGLKYEETFWFTAHLGGRRCG
jgi:hypothetical protein